MARTMSQTWQPRLGDRVVLESEHNRTYLYDQDSKSYVLLDNQVAVRIAEMCDGSRTVEAISRSLAESFPEADLKQVSADVSDMVEALRQQAFLGGGDPHEEE